MTNQRKRNSLINSSTAVISNIVIMLCSFIMKAVLARSFSADYVGLEGYFANVIGIFSFTEGGFSIATAYCLFAPIHNQDHKLVASIMRYIKKIYRVIGVVIILVSFLFTLIIATFTRGINIEVYYIKIAFLIYALGTGISFFWSYQRIYVYAIQKNYIITIVDTITKAVSTAIAVFVVMFLGNYLLYLLALTCVKILGEIMIYCISRKQEGVNIIAAKQLNSEVRNDILAQVKVLTYENICYLGVASTDNIIIATLLTGTILAKNLAYTTIATACISFSNAALRGGCASLGDLVADGNGGLINQYANRYLFAYFYVASLVFVGVSSLANPVVGIWMGKDYCFNSLTTVIIALALLLQILQQPLGDLLNIGGLFMSYKKYAIWAPAINLLTSVGLSFCIGIKGVYIGTILSYSFMIFVSLIVSQDDVYRLSTKTYVFDFVTTLLIGGIGSGVVDLMMQIIHQNVFVNLGVGFLVAVGIHTLLCFVVWHRRKEYIFFGELVKNIIRRITK